MRNVEIDDAAVERHSGGVSYAEFHRGGVAPAYDAIKRQPGGSRGRGFAGDSTVERTTKRFRLTNAGLEFVPVVERILDDLQAGVENVHASSELQTPNPCRRHALSRDTRARLSMAS